MKAILLILSFLALACNVCAEDRTFLYGDYYAGMSHEEFLKFGPADCDEFQNGKMVCNRQKIAFAALEWTQFFEFTDKGLNCVAFGRRLSIRGLDAALDWLEENHYVPVKAEAGEKSVNFTLLYEERGKSEFEKESDNFIREVPAAPNMAAHLIKESVLDEFKTVDKMPADAVVATLAGSKTQGLVFVCFEPAENFTFTLLP